MPGKIDSLTSLRFFAALAVLIHHGAKWLPDATHVFARGYANPGVSFFFCLSGFVLFYSYGELSGQSKRGFYLKRIARIWPLHLLMFAMMILIHPYFLKGDHYAPFGGPAVGALSNIFLLHAWVGIDAFSLSFNGPSWSISVELMFYLLFPILAWNFKKTWHWKVLGSVAVVMAMISICEHLQLPSFKNRSPQVSTSSLLQFFPIVRLVEFVAGMGAALWVREGRLSWMRGCWWLQLAILALIITIPYWRRELVSALAWSKESRTWINFSGLFPLYCIAIIAFSTDSSCISKGLTWKPLVVLGEASYALYLAHIPLKVLCFRHLHWNIQEPGLLGVIYFSCWAVASIVLSLALWKYYEIPMRKLILKLPNMLSRRSDKRA